MTGIEIGLDSIRRGMEGESDVRIVERKMNALSFRETLERRDTRPLSSITMPLDLIDLMMQWMSTPFMSISLMRTSTRGASATRGMTGREGAKVEQRGFRAPMGRAYRVFMERTDRPEMHVGASEITGTLMVRSLVSVPLLSLIEHLIGELRVMTREGMDGDYLIVLSNIIHTLMEIEGVR
jgi:hypothetical protein